MNAEQRDQLHKVAEAATPGPWSFYDDSNDGKTNRIEIVAIGKTVARIYHSVPEEDLPNAAHIAAANPSTILQLLDYIETLEKDVAHKQAWIDALMLEFCPEEMTKEQVAEWVKHQVPAKGETE